MKFRNPPTMAAMASVALLMGGTASAERDIDLHGGFGYDSNPFDLNESVATREGAFAEVEAQVSAEGLASKGWVKKADIGVSGRLYETGMDDADEGDFYVRARGNSNEEPTRHGWEWSLRSQVHEETYVSRFTGVEATDDAGNPIGDRYDYMGGDFQAAWRLPRWSFGRISIEGSYAYKGYLDDYEASGLDRLDNVQYGVAPQYEIGDRDDFLRVRLRLEERIYQERRVSDAAGDPVPRTDLEYQYYGADIRYHFTLARRNSFDLRGGYEIREDNGVGFADRTRWETSIQWTYRPKDKSRLSVELQYSSRTYDQQTVGDPTINDEVPEKKGFDVAIRYARPFPFLDIRGFSLVAEAGWESYDNTNDIRYEYDRMIGFVGVRQEF